ncbi:hypothetical protein VVD49_13480 [Uliginosibacterium sp. H3]|uniref:DNA-binding protein n=1 Tax=Uliginosibacterium silvisoli TaxID=3114758 RepID=A0ABU6K4V0_9RHOO|nr:hypothetical protein [Uliginosibacterium sp. H3]
MNLSLFPVGLLDRHRFAELVGVDVGVVDGWIAKKYVPVLHLGKRSLINVAALHQRALEQGKDFIASGVAK